MCVCVCVCVSRSLVRKQNTRHRPSAGHHRETKKEKHSNGQIIWSKKCGAHGAKRGGPAAATDQVSPTLGEARAVPSAFVGEGAALCYAKGISAATGMESSRETVGSWSQ